MLVETQNTIYKRNLKDNLIAYINLLKMFKNVAIVIQKMIIKYILNY